jgi:[CysO sulfur-carrier protein]-S-L-cysteine hydrolase
MISQLTLDQTQMDGMIRHVDENAPLEACGLLAGKNDRVVKVILVRNQAQSPARFVMDPYEQLQAFEWIESQALELIGIFHSHPAGPETASPTDIAEAAYEVVHIILSGPTGQWRARGFWIESGKAVDVTLQVTNP